MTDFYEITVDNANVKELKSYRYLEIANVSIKLASVALISLTIIFSEYYWLLVAAVFSTSMIISFMANGITKYFKYTFINGRLIVTKTDFGKKNKAIFDEYVKNCSLSINNNKKTRYIKAADADNYKLLYADNKCLVFSPDVYMQYLIENNKGEL